MEKDEKPTVSDRLFEAARQVGEARRGLDLITRELTMARNDRIAAEQRSAALQAQLNRHQESFAQLQSSFEKLRVEKVNLDGVFQKIARLVIPDPAKGGDVVNELRAQLNELRRLRKMAAIFGWTAEKIAQVDEVKVDNTIDEMKKSLSTPAVGHINEGKITLEFPDGTFFEKLKVTDIKVEFTPPLKPEPKQFELSFVVDGEVFALNSQLSHNADKARVQKMQDASKKIIAALERYGLIPMRGEAAPRPPAIGKIHTEFCFQWKRREVVVRIAGSLDPTDQREVFDALRACFGKGIHLPKLKAKLRRPISDYATPECKYDYVHGYAIGVDLADPKSERTVFTLRNNTAGAANESDLKKPAAGIGILGQGQFCGCSTADIRRWGVRRSEGKPPECLRCGGYLSGVKEATMRKILFRVR